MNKTKAVKNAKPLKFTICSSLQTEIVRQVKLNTFARSFLAHAKFFTWKLVKKLLKAVCFMNEWRPNAEEHSDYSKLKHRKTRLLRLKWSSIRRIGKDIRANFYLLLEGRPMQFPRLSSLRWPGIAMMI